MEGIEDPELLKVAGNNVPSLHGFVEPVVVALALAHRSQPFAFALFLFFHQVYATTLLLNHHSRAVDVDIDVFHRTVHAHWFLHFDLIARPRNAKHIFEQVLPKRLVILTLFALTQPFLDESLGVACDVEWFLFHKDEVL